MTEIDNYYVPEEMDAVLEDEYSGKNFANYRKAIVTKVAYLVGIDFEKLQTKELFVPEIVDEMSTHEYATVIRNLCILRKQFFCNYRKISNERMNNYKRIEELDAYLDIELIKELRKIGIEVATVSDKRDPFINIAYINQYIQDNIDKVRNLFPEWIKFNYLRSLFLIPKGYSGKNGETLKRLCSTVKNAIISTSIAYTNSFKFYPYGAYLSWPCPLCKKDGNILFNDLKFLRLLYEANHDSFTAKKYVVDAKMAKKEDIYRFVSDAKNIVAYVDCENVDPYAFAATLVNLNEDNLSKIKSIKLYDDVHTSTAWDYLSKLTSIPVEHIEVERLLENKSLVDMKMAISVAKEYYEDDVESALLVSSDSDFWALIDGMKEKVSFYVLNEKEKTSVTVIETLDKHGVSHCYMSDFAQDVIQQFKAEVLYLGLESRVKEFNETGTFIPLKVYDLIDEIFREAYIVGETGQIKREKEAFYTKYFSNGWVIRPVIENDEPRMKIIVKRK